MWKRKSGLLPGDKPVSVEMFQGDTVPQMIEITYQDGDRLVLRAIGRFSPRDARLLRSLVK